MNEPHELDAIGEVGDAEQFTKRKATGPVFAAPDAYSPTQSFAVAGLIPVQDAVSAFPPIALDGEPESVGGGIGVLVEVEVEVITVTVFDVASLV